jgi:photosystem II stability/assembly factor-like uncharacterized protein
MRKYVLTAVAFILMFTANAQWLQQNAGFTNDTLGFYEMSLPNKNTAWAVCFDIKASLNRGRFILDFTRTTDGGATWIPGKMGNDHTLQFSNISAIDENEAWVAMNKRFTTGGGLYHTTDGGVTWGKSNPYEIFDENSYPNFVHFKDKNHGVAMGDPNGGYFEIYTTNNGGKKWKRVPQANVPAMLPNEYGFISGFAALDKTIWFGTSSGRMYKSTNFGKDWTVSMVDPAGKFVNEIAFNDDMLHGVAHLRDNPGNTFLYSTADGGATWTNLGQPTNWKSSRITAVPGTNALISTGINSNPAFRGSAISYDNGSTWTEIERAVQKTVSRFFDASTGYACGAFVTGPPLRGGIFKSQITFERPSLQNSNAGILATSKQSEKITKDALVKVYPSPANDRVNISLPDEMANTVSVIRIVSMDGKVVETRRSKASNIIQLNVSKLPRGMYMIHVTANNKTINQAITIAR